jgi:hypothetical protein
LKEEGKEKPVISQEELHSIADAVANLSSCSSLQNELEELNELRGEREEYKEVIFIIIVVVILLQLLFIYSLLLMLLLLLLFRAKTASKNRLVKDNLKRNLIKSLRNLKKKFIQ